MKWKKSKLVGNTAKTEVENKGEFWSGILGITRVQREDFFGRKDKLRYCVKLAGKWFIMP